MNGKGRGKGGWGGGGIYSFWHTSDSRCVPLVPPNRSDSMETDPNFPLQPSAVWAALEEKDGNFMLKVLNFMLAALQVRLKCLLLMDASILGSGLAENCTCMCSVSGMVKSCWQNDLDKRQQLAAAD